LRSEGDDAFNDRIRAHVFSCEDCAELLAALRSKGRLSSE